MTEHERARAWRERHQLSKEQLASLTGYSYEAVNLFERGVTPPRVLKGRKRPTVQEIDPAVWKRWKNCCAAVEAMLAQRKHFDW